ncbi:MAG: hypothetical protein RIE52_04060 [Balneola sp.]|jgi:nucleoside phosphorylase
MASKHTQIKRSINEFKHFLDYHGYEFSEANKHIKPSQGWAVYDSDIYDLMYSLYSNLYDELYPKLSEDHPATDEEIIDFFKGALDYLDEKDELFRKIVEESERGELSLAEATVFELVSKTKYKLNEVIKLATQDRLSQNTHSKKESIDVAIITVTYHEEKEALSLIDNETTSEADDYDSNIYYKGSILSGSDKKSIVLTKAHHQGPASSATTTAKLLQKYSPKILFMVGHLAGNKNRKNDIKLGDIIIGEETVDYQQIEVVEKDESFRKRDKKRPISINSNLKSHLESFIRSKKLYKKIKESYPEKDSFKSDLNVHLGKIVSGSALLRASTKFDEIISDNPGLLGLDMESHAFYYACQNTYSKNEPLFVSVKSVSDYGEEKNKFEGALKKPNLRQEYASFTSAKFVLEFINYYFKNG